MSERPAKGGNDVTLVGLFGEFRYFEGSMTEAMASVQAGQQLLRSDLAAGLLEIREALEAEADEDAELRARLTRVETAQAIVYKILAALGLLVAGGLAELVRRSVVGG
ncbi:MAG: hypothetical protein GY898_23020 [Proteobacteria bacterium]|nr:hypothetical protein [Pseudomonadota bacterium]